MYDAFSEIHKFSTVSKKEKSSQPVCPTGKCDYFLNFGPAVSKCKSVTWTQLHDIDQGKFSEQAFVMD